MKSPMPLIEALMADASRGCSTSLQRDILTISRRYQREGISFVTITLPNFSDWLVRSIEARTALHDIFCFFHKAKTSSLPAFLQGLTSQIFDSATGVLLPVPSVEAIFFIRQVCMSFKKIRIECSTKRTQSAFAAYVKCEEDIHEKDIGAYSPDSYFDRVSGIVWNDVLQTRTPSGLYGWEYYDTSNLLPRHGPGATADGICGNHKFQIQRWYQRMDSVFPLDSFALPNSSWSSEEIDVLEPEAELPVKVVAVPKTLKTPRIIAEEPAHVQYVQQALFEVLVPLIERSKLAGLSVRFTSQKENQAAALHSSQIGTTMRLATLDLKEASDRVSLELVKRSLYRFPELCEMLLAARSTRAQVPGFGLISLSKFASMGSALCFPIEAMMFYIIVISAILKARHICPSCRSIQHTSHEVHVYGDDIIVPVDMVPCVIEALQSFGLVVNLNKSFWKGNFRESCGVDAFDGHDVTPTYVRQVQPVTRHSVEALTSWIELSNNFHSKGCWIAADFCRSVVEDLIGPLPLVNEYSSSLGLTTFTKTVSITGWNSFYQRYSVRGFRLYAPLPKSHIEGRAALMKFYLKRSDKPYDDKKHLERFGRPVCAYIKRRWCLA